MGSSRYTKTFIALAVLAWISSPAYSYLTRVTNPDETGTYMLCPSGQAQANLTGWMLDGKMPRGTAFYDNAAKRLEVKVESVSRPDGHRLTVLIDDQRIGELAGLKGGAGTGVITRQLEDGDRVRVFDGDRPIVSGNLVCVAAPTPTATPTPTASPSPTSTPTPDPTPTPTVSPTPTPPSDPTVSPTP